MDDNVHITLLELPENVIDSRHRSNAAWPHHRKLVWQLYAHTLRFDDPPAHTLSLSQCGHPCVFSRTLSV